MFKTHQTIRNCHQCHRAINQLAIESKQGGTNYPALIFSATENTHSKAPLCIGPAPSTVSLIEISENRRKDMPSARKRHFCILLLSGKGMAPGGTRLAGLVLLQHTESKNRRIEALHQSIFTHRKTNPRTNKSTANNPVDVLTNPGIGKQRNYLLPTYCINHKASERDKSDDAQQHTKLR